MAPKFTNRFRRTALPELFDEFGGNILKHLRRQADFVNALELGDGDQQAIEVGLAGISLEIAKGDGRRFLGLRIVGIGFLTGQQSVDGGFVVRAQPHMNGR